MLVSSGYKLINKQAEPCPVISRKGNGKTLGFLYLLTYSKINITQSYTIMIKHVNKRAYILSAPLLCLKATLNKHAVNLYHVEYYIYV